MQNRAHYAIGIYTHDHTMYAGHAAYTGPIYTNKLFYCTSHAVYIHQIPQQSLNIHMQDRAGTTGT